MIPVERGGLDVRVGSRPCQGFSVPVANCRMPLSSRLELGAGFDQVTPQRARISSNW